MSKSIVVYDTPLHDLRLELRIFLRGEYTTPCLGSPNGGGSQITKRMLKFKVKEVTGLTVKTSTVAMSLGWSVRDIFAGIGVLIHVFEALDNSKGAKASYAELIRELASFQSALDGIERSGLSTVQASLPSSTQTVVEEVVQRCQCCIDIFVSRIGKFKAVDMNQSGSKWYLEIFKKNVRAVEWAMCKKGEIDEFRKAVLSHTAAILSLQITSLRYSRQMPSAN
jgi:hypothetical protein